MSKAKRPVVYLVYRCSRMWDPELRVVTRNKRLADKHLARLKAEEDGSYIEEVPFSTRVDPRDICGKDRK